MATKNGSRKTPLVTAGADGNEWQQTSRIGAPGDLLGPGELPPDPSDNSRYVGFCRACRDFTELDDNVTCQRAGHTRDSVKVILELDKDEPLPHMPALNLGALFMPALWGPVHGQWYMILFYPLWLFLDNLIYGSVHGQGVPVLTAIACMLAAGFTIYYGLTANSYGYIRAASEKTPEEYLRVERRWSVAFVLLAVLFLVFATWYNLVVRPQGA